MRLLGDEFDLGQLADKKIGRLSSSEQMRVGMAKALANNSRLRLLDESTASLHLVTARELRGKVLKLVQSTGCAVFWTFHNMREIEEVSDRMIFLPRGQIMIGDTPENLRNQFEQEELKNIFVGIAKERLRATSRTSCIS